MNVRLLNRDTVAVYGAYSIKDDLKKIPTARWNKEAKAWCLSRTEPVLQALKQLVSIPEEVDLEPLDAADITEYKDPPPWTHQLDISREVLKRSSYIHGGMGVGKTRACIDAIINGRLKHTLVVCPTSVIFVWRDQFERWTDRPIDVVCLDGSKSTAQRAKRMQTRLSANDIDGTQTVIVINYEAIWRPAVGEALSEVQWDLIIYDEAHRIKSPSGRSAKFAAKLRTNATRVSGMSGTIMPHGPLDVFSQYRAIDPGVFGESLTRFRAQYENSAFTVRPVGELPAKHGPVVESIIAGDKTYSSTFGMLMGIAASCMRYGASDQEIVDTISYVCQQLRRERPYTSQLISVIKTVRKTNVWRNLDDLKARLDTVTLHVDRSVLTLPPSIDADRYVQLSPQERKMHDEMLDTLSTEVQEGTVTARNALTKLLRLQQITGGFVTLDGEGRDARQLQDVGSSRRDALKEIFEDLGADEPVVVFCRFWRDLDNVSTAAFEMTGKPALELSGRKKELEDWQKQDAPPVLAVQIQTGGLGVDLTRACYAVYYSVGYSLGDLEQAKARIHRPGQTRPVTHIRMSAPGTVDAMIWRAIEAKKDIVESILGEL